jgi:hypothetical protein
VVVRPGVNDWNQLKIVRVIRDAQKLPNLESAETL